MCILLTNDGHSRFLRGCTLNLIMVMTVTPINFDIVWIRVATLPAATACRRRLPPPQRPSGRETVRKSKSKEKLYNEM